MKKRPLTHDGRQICVSYTRSGRLGKYGPIAGLVRSGCQAGRVRLLATRLANVLLTFQIITSRLWTTMNRFGTRISSVQPRRMILNHC